jgi:hypothetical protein
VKSATRTSAGTWTISGNEPTVPRSASTRAQSKRTIAGAIVKIVSTSISRELIKK